MACLSQAVGKDSRCLDLMSVLQGILALETAFFNWGFVRALGGPRFVASVGIATESPYG
jgi:hypothetical protein